MINFSGMSACNALPTKFNYQFEDKAGSRMSELPVCFLTWQTSEYKHFQNRYFPKKLRECYAKNIDALDISVYRTHPSASECVSGIVYSCTKYYHKSLR